MPITIYLSKEWEDPDSGVQKPAGTKITFSSRSPKAKQILEDGFGHPEVQLPKDMPARQKFLDAGLDSLQELLKLQDWKEVKGIGDITAKKLNEYFNVEGNDGND